MSIIPPLFFSSGILVTSADGIKKLRERESLFIIDTCRISTNVIPIDSALAFLSHVETATCSRISQSTKTTSVITVHVRCRCCQKKIFAIDLNLISTNFTIILSRICPHQTWSCIGTQGRQTIFSSPPGFSLNQHPTDHPLRRFGKIIDKNNLLDKIYQKEIRSIIWSQSKLYDMEINENDSNSLISIIESLPGHVILGISETPIHPGWKEDTKLDDAHHITSLSWLAPWALQVMNFMNYLELDASFKALKPFAYSIPTAIYKNKSIPLGLFFYNGEKRELFSNFIEMVLQHGAPIELLQSKGFLTDEGTAIKATMKQFHLTRHSCYRHLIEKMGSSSVLGAITRRLLFCSTRIAYETKINEAILEIRQLYEIGKITEKQVIKFSKLFDLSISDAELLVVDTLDHHNALWLRAIQGIASCSNHLERLHRTLNEATSTIRLFSRRLYTVVTMILEWPKNFSKRQHRQEKEVLDQLKENVATYNIQQTEECNNSFCGWSFFYSNLFGVTNFPCAHTLNFQVPFFTEIEFPSFFTEPNFIEIIEINSNIQNSGSIITITTKKKNQIELLSSYSGSIFDFLMETAEEIFLLNPKAFKNKYHALCIVTNRWTLFTDGTRIEAHLLGQEEDEEEENNEIDQLDETKAEFRVNLFTDSKIIVNS
jgi:hypothetical protein